MLGLRCDTVAIGAKGLETIGAAHATAKREIKLDTALRGLKGTSVKLHPGAEKFYKEKGLLK